MGLKLNFWETFAISTGLSALEALVSDKSKLSDQQKADVTASIESLRKVQADFAA